jgi:hypothetical protein
MDTQRLKVKIGDNEFEAEGPPESVQAQFDAWKSLVSTAPPTVPDKPASDGSKPGETQEETGELPSIFSVDDRKKLVSLAVLPAAGAGNRDADAMLLLLYGYKVKYGLEDLIVGRLKESMAVSGRRIERIDRTIQPHLKANYVLKGGQGKGGKYRLTNTGIARAKELMEALT